MATKPNLNTDLKRDAASAQTPEAIAAAIAAERARQTNSASGIKQTAKDQLQDAASSAIYDSVAGPDALAALRAGRSPEANKIIASAMDQTKGINAQENSALRQNFMSSINSQNQGALRLLRGQQSANGVRGGVASAQIAGQNAAAGQALGAAEGSLVEKNIAAKQEGLKNAATIVNNQENKESDQATDKLSTILAIRGNKTSLQAAKLQADATPGSAK